MSYTVVYSKYNGYPGSKDTYNFRGARETPLLPDVNLYNSFNFEVKSTTANANASTTQESGAGSCLLYTSPSPRDQRGSRMPSSA